LALGKSNGKIVGLTLGNSVGIADGLTLGKRVGILVGLEVGVFNGFFVGYVVGSNDEDGLEETNINNEGLLVGSLEGYVNAMGREVDKAGGDERVGRIVTVTVGDDD